MAACLISAAVVAWPSPADAQRSSAGISDGQRQRQFERALAQSVTVAWREQQLGDALRRLAELYDIDVWLDRRVDPNQQVNLERRGQSLADVVTAAATQCGLGVSHRGGVVYVGPEESAAEVATLLQLARDSLDNTASVRRRQWMTRQPANWPRLSEPRTLIEAAAAELEATVVGAEAVPHDLWAERSEVWIAPIDLAVLTLLGFDLTCRIEKSGAELHILPVTRPVVLVRSYADARTKRDRANKEQVDQWIEELPSGWATRTGNKLTLRAPVEQHEMLRRLLRGAPPSPRERRPPRSRGKDVYTLQIANQPVGRVMNQLARQLQLEVRWDVPQQRTEEIKAQLVSCRVREASLDELLAAVLNPAGLQSLRDGRQVTIRQPQ